MLGVCVAEGVGRLQVGWGHIVRDCNTPGFRLAKYWRFREAEVLAWVDHEP